MFRVALKTRLLEDGGMEIVDPDMESLPLLRAINPGFKIKRSTIQSFQKPHLKVTIRQLLPVGKDDLMKIKTRELWDLHENISLSPQHVSHGKGKASLLDLKIELAKRALLTCHLCGRKCGVNRIAGEAGFCGLGIDSAVGECFIHITEEAPINPSININIRGCGLKCSFCQKYDLLDLQGPGVPLEPIFWEELRSQTARSVSFIGGNPDESVYSILRFLSHAPSWFNKPICWNSNGYASRTVYELLRGVVDIYIPDMKFHDKGCSQNLAGGCSNYFEMFQEGITEMVQQGVPIIVRMLVMPGHLQCCHFPLIKYLARYNKHVRLNIMGQYYPDYQVSQQQSPLNRRPAQSEIDDARSYAVRLVNSDWLITSDYGRK